jgi:hypothetical protein
MQAAGLIFRLSTSRSWLRCLLVGLEPLHRDYGRRQR